MAQKNAIKGLFEGSKLWVTLAAICALVAAGLGFVLLNAVSSTTTYYVINREIPARTQLTVDMLTPRVASVGGQPPTAMGIAEVATGEVFAKFDLAPGDVLTSSNAGSLTPLTAGIPEDFVVASFLADPSSAAAGNISRGDYIDIFIVGDRDGLSVSRLVMQRVLVLAATIDLDGEEEVAPAEEGEATVSNVIPSLFTVGVSLENAATLALIADGSVGDAYVVLSSIQSVTDGAEDADISDNGDDLFTRISSDAGVGTDNTFAAPGTIAEEDPEDVPEQGVELSALATTEGTTEFAAEGVAAGEEYTFTLFTAEGDELEVGTTTADADGLALLVYDTSSFVVGETFTLRVTDAEGAVIAEAEWTVEPPQPGGEATPTPGTDE
jgi:hypothetical protein